jgi:hypothetical protein
MLRKSAFARTTDTAQPSRGADCGPLGAEAYSLPHWLLDERIVVITPPLVNPRCAVLALEISRRFNRALLLDLLRATWADKIHRDPGAICHRLEYAVLMVSSQPQPELRQDGLKYAVAGFDFGSGPF